MANSLSNQTIFALATPMGRSGIAVVRVSGPSSISNVRKIAPWLVAQPESHRLYFGTLQSLLNPGKKVDEVLLSIFHEGRSYTGEESVEISCHGNPLIIDEIQRELSAAGCRLAHPGEFTSRAFMNGRLDLVQAESVLSLIESQSPFEKENALKQLGGEISGQVSQLEKKALRTMAHIEADIDFSTEGLETMPKSELRSSLKSLMVGLENLLAGYRRGRVLTEGFHVVFAGAPNTGKSSLLNLVLGEDRAIVTSQAGTTRDLVEGWKEVGGIRVSWMDTAGLRSTEDLVESLGIHKVREVMKRADLIFWVFAPDVFANAELLDDLNWALSEKAQSLVFLLNKSDLISTNLKDSELAELYSIPPEVWERSFELPHLRGTSSGEKSAEFKEQIVRSVEDRVRVTGAGDSVVISRSRHFESLSRALQQVQEADRMAEQGLGNELVAMPLKEALIDLQAVLGIRYDEQIIDQIFKEFCLGK